MLVIPNPTTETSSPTEAGLANEKRASGVLSNQRPVLPVIVRIRQTGWPHHLREAHTGLESDQGEVVTPGDVIGHRGQVPARVEDNVSDPEAGAAPGDQVTHTEVDTDISRVEAVTTPGAGAHQVTLPCV